MNSFILSILTSIFAWTTAAEQYQQQQAELSPPPDSTQQSDTNPPNHAPGTDSQSDESTANQQAIYWLSLVDASQYGSAWLACGSLLRDVVSQDQYSAALKGQREKVGRNQGRKLTSKQQTKSLRYGTRGDFIVIQYNSNFSNKPGVTETVTLMADGRLKQWKVVSYTIGR
ncbi:MAG: hypothetical protein S4CHLAM45_09880 [Chlamydiales bacterium]|nr:hypothetical protein [Chlamydiales bacterium]MCH9620194.1 hypothetical protein [Chlamydiales bacterium]MCH9623091.1 hypothetical protein [Chlamydiales bacterium]